jgi:hypothetical protein
MKSFGGGAVTIVGRIDCPGFRGGTTDEGLSHARGAAMVGVHRVSIVTADVCFRTLPDSCGRCSPLAHQRARTVRELWACFPSSWSRVRIPSLAPVNRDA